MNRLVIIGNGFDLAHGLKTSYKDFLKWYFIRAYTTAEEGTYKDNFITIIRNYPHKFQSSAFSNITEWVDFVFDKNNKTTLNHSEYANNRYVMRNFFSTTFKSAFLKN
jgi:hypothetical protein